MTASFGTRRDEEAVFVAGRGQIAAGDEVRRARNIVA
jgi:hypothetical protein